MSSRKPAKMIQTSTWNKDHFGASSPLIYVFQFSLLRYANKQGKIKFISIIAHP
jgi:hypothetical protein